jgi:hypothetical protein
VLAISPALFLSIFFALEITSADTKAPRLYQFGIRDSRHIDLYVHVETDLDAPTDSVKLDQLLELGLTMNTRLDHQSQRLTIVETTIPLLAKACGVFLPSGSSSGSSDTDVGSGAGGGWGMTTLAISNDHDPGDELDSVMLESARTNGMGPS